MKLILLSTALVIMSLFSCESKKEIQKPNILLIVADDLGYADLGVYGSDIETPNIDALARKGLIFTQFHTAVMCAPSRAMLLTGNDNHVAGIGMQSPRGSYADGMVGYEGYLSDRVVPLPQLLKDAGYFTCTAGKWHVGEGAEHSPKAKGFTRSFNLLFGGGNHYNSIGLFASDSVSQYREDGELVEYPEGNYSTEFYTNKLMQYIAEANGQAKPFFAFAAYTSPHWPLQSPKEFDKYKGRYDMGYDSLRVLRLASLKKAGIIPQESTLPPRLDFIKPWDTLTEDEKKIESRKMELYAAMVDNLDHHVGRLVQFLKDKGLYENTIIVFLSDNGAAAEDFFNHPSRGEFLRSKYDNSYANMGSPTSFVSYGPQWAQAGAAPFNRHKGFPTEGGITAPMIIHGKDIPENGSVSNVYCTIMDLAPTLLDVAGIQYPGQYQSETIRPMKGETMMPFLSGKQATVHDENYWVGFEHRQYAYVRKGDWKIVNIQIPFDEKNLALYNLKQDPGETRDLAGEHIELYRELVSLWKQYAEEVQVVFPKPQPN
ncbi:MAG: arylsulfatase [Cyclobacteriaceae bacterium]|nr:arylsulfatase [Cyclobacteriaceae bacterium]